MGYIDQNLLPEESIRFRTKKHMIIFLIPVLLSLFCAISLGYMQENPLLARIQWAPWLIAAIFWGYTLLEYYTSEFVITNKRIMMREGFFNRHATEVRITTISQVNVDQSLFGQWLNYGNVSIHTFGAADQFSLIAKPMVFQKMINAQMDQLSR